MSRSSSSHGSNIGEWWDVTDEHGHLTCQIHRRGNPDWPPGRFHLIVATCVYRPDGAVLLTQRSATKEFPLAWEFPGGSALAGESSRDAALRELHEETGIQIATSGLTFVQRFSESSALLDFYIAPAANDAGLALCPDEVAAAAWVSLDEVQVRLREHKMPLPWTARLDKLWPPLVEALGKKTSADETRCRWRARLLEGYGETSIPPQRPVSRSLYGC